MIENWKGKNYNTKKIIKELEEGNEMTGKPKQKIVTRGITTVAVSVLYSQLHFSFVLPFRAA